MPPTRPHDHSIVLKEGNTPISIRPYRYTHVQKKRIERLVQDMLKTGMIQLSIGPFASLVILVKKRDGPWPFVSVIEP